MFERLKTWAANLKRDVVALWFAGRDPRTPVLAKLLAIAIVAYALSPVDLIPDFIPVVGYLDDLIILPVAIWIVLRLVPDRVLAQSREKAEQWLAAGQRLPRSIFGLAIIGGLWLLGLWLLWLLLATTTLD